MRRDTACILQAAWAAGNEEGNMGEPPRSSTLPMETRLLRQMPQVYRVALQACVLSTDQLSLLLKTLWSTRVPVAYHSPSTNLAMQNSPRRGA